MGTNKISFGTRTEFSTARTPLASMVGTNLNNINPSLHSFIFDKALQLVETPSIQPEVEPLTFSGFSYAFDVLQHDSSSIAVIDNLLRDYMIPVSLETSLFARNLLQKFLSTSSAFTLESCSQSLEFDSFTFNLATTKELPIACYSNMVYSDINTKKSVATRSLDVDISGKSDMQEHPIMLVNSKNSSLPRPIKIFPIVFRNFNWNINPPIDCSEPNLVKIKCKSSLIKSKRHIFLKGWFSTFITSHRFESLRSNSIGIYNELRRKVKQLPAIIIAKMVKLVSVVGVGFNAFISDIRNSLRVFFHSVKKQFAMLNLQLYCSNGLHIDYKTLDIFKHFGNEGKRAFLPTTKVVGILP